MGAPPHKQRYYPRTDTPANVTMTRPRTATPKTRAGSNTLTSSWVFQPAPAPRRAQQAGDNPVVVDLAPVVHRCLDHDGCVMGCCHRPLLFHRVQVMGTGHGSKWFVVCQYGLRCGHRAQQESHGSQQSYRHGEPRRYLQQHRTDGIDPMQGKSVERPCLLPGLLSRDRQTQLQRQMLWGRLPPKRHQRILHRAPCGEFVLASPRILSSGPPPRPSFGRSPRPSK